MTRKNIEIVAYVLAKCRAKCEPQSFEHVVNEFCHVLSTLNPAFNEGKFRSVVAEGYDAKTNKPT